MDIKNGEFKMNVDCQHNTSKGLTWVRMVKKPRFFGLWKQTLVEKRCDACGATFLADEKGNRLD